MFFHECENPPFRNHIKPTVTWELRCVREQIESSMVSSNKCISYLRMLRTSWFGAWRVKRPPSQTRSASRGKQKDSPIRGLPLQAAHVEKSQQRVDSFWNTAVACVELSSVHQSFYPEMSETFPDDEDPPRYLCPVDCTSLLHHAMQSYSQHVGQPSRGSPICVFISSRSIQRRTHRKRMPPQEFSMSWRNFTFP